MLLRARAVVWATLMVLLAECTSGQQEPSLRLNLLPVLPRARNGAHIEVEARFSYSGSGILTGELVLDLKEGRTLCCRVRTPDVTVIAPGASVMVTLPPLLVPSGTGSVDVLARLRTRDGDIDLGFTQLDFPEPIVRSLVLAVCGGDMGSGSVPTASLKRLLLTQYDPSRQEGRQHRLSCWPLRFGVRDLATSSLGFCAYDVLILTAEAVQEMDSGRWRAMSSWVWAGGAVCVPLPERMSAHLLRRLETLISVSKTPGGPGADGVGETSFETTEGEAEAMAIQRIVGGVKESPVCMDAGIGRIVLLPPGRELATLSPEEIQRVACSLWRLTKGQLESVCATGRWRNDLLRNCANPADPNDYFGARQRLAQEAPAHIPFGLFLLRHRGEFVRGLLPESIRIMPLWLVGLVLAAFVLIIGPVDYFLLGALRRRWLTWIVFPTVCVGCALAMVGVSRQWMGGSDNGRSLRIVDIGSGGRVLRENRFVMLFPGRERRSGFECNGELVQPFGREFVAGMQRGRMPFGAGGDPEPYYSGRLFSRYDFSQNTFQWTAQLNRVLRIGGSNQQTLARWERLDGASREVCTNQRKLDELLFAGVRPRSAVALLVDGWSSEGVVLQSNGEAWVRTWQAVLAELTVPNAGVFSLVSRMSPACGRDVANLALVDPTDSSEWALIVVYRDGRDIVAERRLFRRREGPWSL